MVFDPFEINRKLFSDWEKKLAEFLDKRMRDPDYMSLVSKGMNATMDAKSAVDARMNEWLKQLSIPTREDMERLWTTVNDIETRLIDLEDRVTALERASRTRANAVIATPPPTGDQSAPWAGPAIRPGNLNVPARDSMSASTNGAPRARPERSLRAQGGVQGEALASKKPRARRAK